MTSYAFGPAFGPDPMFSPEAQSFGRAGTDMLRRKRQMQPQPAPIQGYTQDMAAPPEGYTFVRDMSMGAQVLRGPDGNQYIFKGGPGGYMQRDGMMGVNPPDTTLPAKLPGFDRAGPAPTAPMGPMLGGALGGGPMTFAPDQNQQNPLAPRRMRAGGGNVLRGRSRFGAF